MDFAGCLVFEAKFLCFECNLVRSDLMNREPGTGNVRSVGIFGLQEKSRESGISL